MCSNYSVSTRFAQWCAGRDRCLSSRYIAYFPPPGQGGQMVVIFYWSDRRGFVVWGRTRDERLWLFFPPCFAGWMGSFCRDVCGGLGRQSGTMFELLARHHKLMSCPLLSPTELVYFCTVQVLFPSKRVGIAPPPPILFRLGLCALSSRGRSS